MENIRKKLRANISQNTKQEAKEKKLFNIDAFSKKLPRDGLEHNVIERLLHLETTPEGERIYIQYPGKESVRLGYNKRPWDFRPKLFYNNGGRLQDLSFKEVWEDLIKISEKDREILPIIAAVLYRLSMLIDHKFVSKDYDYIDIDKYGNEKGRGKQHVEFYKYAPDPEIIDFMNERIGKIRGTSFEGYMAYTDYLAQNEDCKYTYPEGADSKKWNGMIGRGNNILTHINVIGFLQQKVNFPDIAFSLMDKGVAPISEKQLEDVSGGIIYSGTISFDR